MNNKLTMAENQEMSDSFLVSFALARPVVLATILKIPQLICSYLGFRPSSRLLILFLLSELLDGGDYQARTHEYVARNLYPHHKPDSGKNKVSKAVKVLLTDQSDSHFRFLEYRAGQYRAQHAGTPAAYLPSQYKISAFYAGVCDELSCRIFDAGAMEFPDAERNRFLGDSVRELLKARGAQKIARTVREKERKSKNAPRENEAQEHGAVALARLPLAERVENALNAYFDQAAIVYSLLSEVASPEEGEHLIDKVLRANLTHANMALSALYERVQRVNGRRAPFAVETKKGGLKAIV